MMDNSVGAEMIHNEKSQQEKDPCQITEAQTKKGKVDVCPHEHVYGNGRLCNYRVLLAMLHIICTYLL